jgi:hypothetical protein
MKQAPQKRKRPIALIKEKVTLLNDATDGLVEAQAIIETATASIVAAEQEHGSVSYRQIANAVVTLERGVAMLRTGMDGIGEAVRKVLS